MMSQLIIICQMIKQVPRYIAGLADAGTTGRRAWSDSGIYQAQQAHAGCLYRTVQPDVQDRNTGFLSVWNAE